MSLAPERGSISCIASLVEVEDEARPVLKTTRGDVGLISVAHAARLLCHACDAGIDTGGRALRRRCARPLGGGLEANAIARTCVVGAALLGERTDEETRRGRKRAAESGCGAGGVNGHRFLPIGGHFFSRRRCRDSRAVGGALAVVGLPQTAVSETIVRVACERDCYAVLVAARAPLVTAQAER
jgi:hypothetical protein